MDSALILNAKVLNMVGPPVDSLILSDVYSVSGILDFNLGAYEEALVDYFKSLKLREAINDTAKIISALGNIGNVYYYTNAFDQAISYHTKAVQLGLKFNARLISSNYNTIGLVFTAKQELDSALSYFNKGFKVCKLNGTDANSQLADLHDNIATVFELNGSIDSTIFHLSKAITIHQELQDNIGIAWTALKLGNVFFKNKENSKAYNWLMFADSIANRSATIELRKDIYYSIFEYYMSINEMDSSRHYILKYVLLNDSIINLKTSKNIQEMEAKYQLASKQSALELSNEKATRLDLENSRSNMYLWISGLAIILLLIAILLIRRWFKQREFINSIQLELRKRKMQELLSNQESESLAAMLEGQEKERERIAQELHDRLGGTLAALRLALRSAKNKIDEANLSIVDTAVEEVRGIAHNLSSGVLKKHGFNEAIDQLRRRIVKSNQVDFQLYLHPDINLLGQSTSLELYRITQELINNALKHSDATTWIFQVNLVNDTFNFIFEDNGRGFDIRQVKRGIGLYNIEERVRKIGGEITIDAEVGRGVIVIIELKLNK